MMINNISKNAKRYVVAREVDWELWYWGSFEDRDKANEVALEINGVMIDIEEA